MTRKPMTAKDVDAMSVAEMRDFLADRDRQRDRRRALESGAGRPALLGGRVRAMMADNIAQRGRPIGAKPLALSGRDLMIYRMNHGGKSPPMAAAR
jgi:hypothetical protein